MNVTGDPDPDAYSKPKFNSTVLESDERTHTREGSKNAGTSDAMKLSPIPKDHMQFIGSNVSSFPEQQHFHNCSDLQDSSKKFKKMKLGDETSMSFIGSNSNSAGTDKENIVITVSESNIHVEGSVQSKSNSTARSQITNPFDSDIMGSLSATTYSPNLFNNSKRDVACETPEKSFNWSIGQLADFHPAIIDETQPMCQTPDPVEEAQINNAIEKFWASQKYVFPSPYCKEAIKVRQEDSPSLIRRSKEAIKLRQEDSPGLIRRSQAVMQISPLARPPMVRSNESKQSVEVQTMFTFPPNLDLAGLLGHCFQYERGEVAIFEANLSLNTLRRKLSPDSLSHTNIENEDGDSAAMAIDDNYDENEPFKLERPAWYRSNDEIMPTRKASFDGITDANEGNEISTDMLSPNISPIKN